MQSITIATNPPLTPNAGRADLVVGRNLTVDGGGGSVPNGRVTCGGALTASGTFTALGGLHHAQPPFDFAAQFSTMRERSAQWADLTPNGTVSGPTYNVLTLTGRNPARNVFAITTAQLQSAGQVTIDVTAGSTTLINVTGSSITSGLYRIELVGGSPDKVLWNFPLATAVQQASGLDWQGTLLAPDAAVNVADGNLYGQVAGGARYSISEPDPLGAIASVDKSPVTILDSQSEIVTVGNDFPTSPAPPVPPNRRSRRPRNRRSRPARWTRCPDPTWSSRHRCSVARTSRSARPSRPNQVARILGVKAGPRVAGCTSTRPVSCGGATLPVRAEVVIRVRARILIAGIFKSVIVATSRTPDPNTTNNLAVNGLVVRRPASVAVGVHAPAVAGVGQPVA